ncbi:hypothetical protein ACEQ8H_003202 [Pleosporales sp. CAS-2024a]
MRFSSLACVASGLQVCTSAAGVERDTTPYDFIIVGGGTAGLAVASRISIGLLNARVLVIEAGPDGRHEPGISIPGRKGSTLGGKYDWNLTTIAQPTANNRTFAQNRGKVLGGSSALNLMTWDRTTVAELDAWEKLGNPGWNWTSLYSAMLKCEKFLPSSVYGDAGVGKSGPIKTLINRIFPKHQSTWYPTLNTLGLQTNYESLNGSNIGVSTQPSSVSPNYNRSYAPEYLKLVKDNFVLQLKARVAKINFMGNTATGVTLENGTVICARKEVILSAGTFLTPGLLELSGIGNATLLRQLGIPVIKDLPSVGENLQDHIRIQSSYILNPEYSSFDVLKNATRAAAELARYKAGKVSLYDYTASGYAYLSWSTVSSTTASFLSALVESDPSLNSPIDMMKKSYFAPPLSSTVPQLEVIFSDGYTGLKGYPAANSSLFGINTFSLIGVVQHPFSKGSVHIASTNISCKPYINPNYLSHPYDLAAAANLAKYLRTIATSPPMSTVWTQEYEPGSAVQTDEQWKQWALSNVLSIYHPIGTAALLPEEDGGVVSPELKVYGVNGLRVVDASVIPLLPSAHLQTLVYGIGERAADMIINEYKTAGL